MLAQFDHAARGRTNLRASEPDVVQQVVVEPRQLPFAGVPARVASHRIDHPFMDALDQIGEESVQTPFAACAMSIVHDLHLQNFSSRETCSHPGLLFRYRGRKAGLQDVF
jgi:hypothetical protein